MTLTTPLRRRGLLGAVALLGAAALPSSAALWAGCGGEATPKVAQPGPAQGQVSLPGAALKTMTRLTLVTPGKADIALTLDGGQWRLGSGHGASATCKVPPARAAALIDSLSTMRVGDRQVTERLARSDAAALGLDAEAAREVRAFRGDEGLLALRVGGPTRSGYAATLGGPAFELRGLDLAALEAMPGSICDDDAARSVSARADRATTAEPPLEIDGRAWLRRLASHGRGELDRCPGYTPPSEKDTIASRTRRQHARDACMVHNLSAMEHLRSCPAKVTIEDAQLARAGGETRLRLPQTGALMTPLGKVWIDGVLVALRGAHADAARPASKQALCDQGGRLQAPARGVLLDVPADIELPARVDVELAVVLDGGSAPLCGVGPRRSAPTARASAVQLRDASTGAVLRPWERTTAGHGMGDCTAAQQFFTARAQAEGLAAAASDPGGTDE